MKKTVLIILLVLAYIELNAQDYNKWNVGLDITPSLYGAILIAPNVNYVVGNNFEIGLMPIYLYEKTTYSNGDYREQNVWGVNLSGKYYFYRENIMDPYGMLLLGFGENYTEYNLTSYPSSSNNSFSNIAALLGNEINIGQKGWNFDFNIGVVWVINTQEVNPMFSVGFKKRFLKK